MIYLFTGLPRHGKTQRAIWTVLNDDRFKNRPVFFANCSGFDLSKPELKNWKPLDDITDWQSLPEYSVIFVDECHDTGFFPVRGTGKPPEWIEKLSVHGHRGVDFVLITQNAKNMDVYVRRLVELNYHVRRPSQLPGTNVYTFQGFTDCDDKVPTASALSHERWKLDPKIWALYKSADAHTVKARLPLKVLAFPAVVLAVAVLGFMSYKLLGNMGNKAADATAKSTGVPLPGSETALKKLDGQIAQVRNGSPMKKEGEPEESLSRMSPQERAEHQMHETRDWQFERVPRVADAPESAPIYDEVRKVVAFPVITGCVTHNGNCKCYNQQGTPEPQTPAACIEFVAQGRFNPYRDEKDHRNQRANEQKGTVATAQAGALGSGRNCRQAPRYTLTGDLYYETECDGMPVHAPSMAANSPATGKADENARQGQGSSGLSGASSAKPETVAPQKT